MVILKQFMPTKKEWFTWFFRDVFLQATLTTVRLLIRKSTDGVRLLPNSEVAYLGDFVVGVSTSGVITPGWQFTRVITGHKSHYGLYIIHKWNDRRYALLRLGYKTNPHTDLKGIVDSGVKIGTTIVLKPYSRA